LFGREEGAIVASDPNKPSILVEMATGYFRSRALCAAVRLGIADFIGDDERTVDQLAVACQADKTALHRLLRALATFGIVSESKPGAFVLTPLGAPLQKTAPNSAWAGVVFWADLLADSWSYLTECVRSGQSAFAIAQRDGISSRWSKDPEAPGIFRAVMGTGPAEDFMPLARAWDFSSRHVVADLGGGGGSLMLAILSNYPTVRGMLVDRRESIERAGPRFADVALRCVLIPADLRESIPPGADVHLLKHVLHGYADDAAAQILQNCRSVLPADGRVLVIEYVLPDLFNYVDKELEGRVMSDLNMLAVTGGKERSAAEWKTVLSMGGFDMHRIVAVPGESVSIIEAAPQ
jgi:hypothetical protein